MFLTLLGVKLSLAIDWRILGESEMYQCFKLYESKMSQLRNSRGLLICNNGFPSCAWSTVACQSFFREKSAKASATSSKRILKHVLHRADERYGLAITTFCLHCFHMRRMWQHLIYIWFKDFKNETCRKAEGEYINKIRSKQNEITRHFLYTDNIEDLATLQRYQIKF